jgi:hypothetical protein
MISSLFEHGISQWDCDLSVKRVVCEATHHSFTPGAVSDDFDGRVPLVATALPKGSARDWCFAPQGPSSCVKMCCLL